MIKRRLPEPLPKQLAKIAPNYETSDPMDAPVLRWGILGAGRIAGVFANDVSAYSSQQISAIGSRELAKAQQFAAAHNLPHAYGSYEELVNSPEVDIVYIATPHIFHHEFALLALRAGKPILVEKAFSMTQAEAEEIFAEAKAQNLFAMEAMWSRHLPHYRFIRAAIEAHLGGNVVMVQSDHGQSLRHVPRLIEPNLGGGALLDLGVYSVHFAHHALGVPSQLQALGRKLGPVDAAEVVIGKYENSPTGALSVASANFDGRSATSGFVTFEDFSIEVPEQFYRPGKVALRTFASRKEAAEEVTTWDAEVPGGFQYQAAEAARCVTAGLMESPVVPWSATLEVMGIMDQIRTQIG